MPTPPLSRESIPSQLLAAKEEARSKYFALEVPEVVAAFAAHPNPRINLVGVGIGFKLVGGKPTARHSIRFYVERKLPKSAISQEFMLPSKVGAFATDVIETGRFRAFVAAAHLERKRLRPARPGASIGFQFSGNKAGYLMAGTFGAVVEADGNWFLLSNNHVLANENGLKPGAPIFQPGLLDKNSPAQDQIARLTKFVPLKVQGQNNVDCAIAEVLQTKLVSPLVLPKVGQLKAVGPLAAAVGMNVEKTGRTTGYTVGKIQDVSADVKVGYDLGTLTFIDQVIITKDGGNFSDAGDSGSLIVERKSKRPVALLFAGSSSHTIANHIDDVLGALGVSIVAK